MESNSDKKISVKQIQSIVNTLQELPFKNVAMAIQILISLEDVNKVNNTNKQESNK
jgi:hypothetical protein